VVVGGDAMTDKQLQDFITHGEEAFMPFAMMFGEGWAQQAIDIAKESRRLHEVNAELVTSLREMVDLMDSGDEHGAGSLWHFQAKAAIAIATGEQQ